MLADAFAGSWHTGIKYGSKMFWTHTGCCFSSVKTTWLLFFIFSFQSSESNTLKLGWESEQDPVRIFEGDFWLKQHKRVVFKKKMSMNYFHVFIWKNIWLFLGGATLLLQSPVPSCHIGPSDHFTAQRHTSAAMKQAHRAAVDMLAEAAERTARSRDKRATERETERQ